MDIKLTEDQVEDIRFTLEELRDHFIGAGYYEDRVKGLADTLGITIDEAPNVGPGASESISLPLFTPPTLILAYTWEEGVALAEQYEVEDFVDWDDFARDCIEPHLEKIPPFDPNANHLDVRNIYKSRILTHCLKEHHKNNTLPSVIVTHWRSEEETHMSRETAPEGTFHLPHIAYFVWPRAIEAGKGQIKGD